MRKYLVGATAAAVMSVAVTGVAQAAYTLQGQSLVVNAAAPKLDKKKPGPLKSLFVDVITDYAGSGVGAQGTVDRKANNTKVYFPKDFVFTTKGIPKCDPNTPGFSTSTTGSALALCGKAKVGAGSAAIVGPIPGVTAVVTAFNGTKVGGQDRILLHSRTSAGTTTVLVGTLKPSNVGGFGKMLDVPVPALPAGLAISDFKTKIGRVKAGKKKKGKPQKYYIMAKCSKKKWRFQAITTYDVGASTTAPARDKCNQK